jgi:hypothetical protein
VEISKLRRVYAAGLLGILAFSLLEVLPLLNGSLGALDRAGKRLFLGVRTKLLSR